MREKEGGMVPFGTWKGDSAACDMYLRLHLSPLATGAIDHDISPFVDARGLARQAQLAWMGSRLRDT